MASHRGPTPSGADAGLLIEHLVQDEAAAALRGGFILYEMLDEKPSVCSAWSGPSMGGQKLTLDIATMARSRVSST